ncbi:MAG: chloride channel protein [Elainellaceae cyanobacterium]
MVKPLSLRQILLYAAGLGVTVGLLSTGYYLLLKLGLQVIWQSLPGMFHLSDPNDTRYYAWILTTLGGFLVGVIVHYLSAPTGLEAAVGEIHSKGRINYQHIPGMAIASLVSMMFGSSAGPEAPLVDINGGAGSWLGDRLRAGKDTTRILTFCGMSAAFGAFFGSPLGSALLALELPHFLGLEYYEALIPVIVAAICGFVVFRLCTGSTIGGIYQFPAYSELQPSHLIHALILGIIGAAVAILFVLIFRGTRYLVARLRVQPVLLTTLGGLGIGLIAIFFPLTLFYGEEQIQTVIDTGTSLGAKQLLLTAIAKMVTVSLCLQTGFRGGFIFPLFFIGATIGMAVHLMLPQIPATVSMVCMMASITVAIMKTPVSMALILTVISDTDLIPIITVSSMISFLLTSNLRIIATQRSRVSD